MKHTAEQAVAYILLEHRRKKGELHYVLEVLDAMQRREFTSDQTYAALESHQRDFRLTIVRYPGARDGYGLEPDYTELAKFAPPHPKLEKGKQLYHFIGTGGKWNEAESEFDSSVRSLQKLLNLYCKETGLPRPTGRNKPGRPGRQK